jgi:hypothetical protein
LTPPPGPPWYAETRAHANWVPGTHDPQPKGAPAPSFANRALALLAERGIGFQRG